MTQKFRKPVHGSLAWHERRRTYKGRPVFTGSEIPALMGASAYETPMSVIAKKLAPIKVTRGNAAMRRGTYLEGGIIDYTKDDRFPTLTTPKFMYVKYPVVVTLDAHVLAGDGSVERVVEVKTTTGFTIDDPLPLDYFWQVQAQMFATGAEVATVACLDRRMRIGYWDVTRNEDAINAMVQTVQGAVDIVASGIVPTTWTMTAADVAAAYVETVPEAVILDSGGFTTVREWAAAKSSVKLAQDTEAHFRDKVVNLLREYEAASYEGQTLVTFKTHKTKRFNSEAFRKDHPALAMKYQTETEQRTLLNKMGDL